MSDLIIGGLTVLPVGTEVRLTDDGLKRFTTAKHLTTTILSREIKDSEVRYKLNNLLFVGMPKSLKIRAKWVEKVEHILNLESINVKSD